MYFCFESLKCNIILTDCVMRVIQYWEIKFTMGFRVDGGCFVMFCFMDKFKYLHREVHWNAALPSCVLYFKAIPLLLKELGCSRLCRTFLSTFSAEHLPAQKLALSHSGTVNSLNLHVVAFWSRVVEEESSAYLARTLLSEKKIWEKLGWKTAEG